KRNRRWQQSSEKANPVFGGIDCFGRGRGFGRADGKHNPTLNQSNSSGKRLCGYCEVSSVGRQVLRHVPQPKVGSAIRASGQFGRRVRRSVKSCGYVGESASEAKRAGDASPGHGAAVRGRVRRIYRVARDVDGSSLGGQRKPWTLCGASSESRGVCQ